MLRLLIIVLFTSLITATSMSGQVEAMFLEANTLFESGRYDEAVRMYNRILDEDEGHTGAMLMRGKTKYELGAYKGTKMDAALYLEKAGATKELIQLMAYTEFKLGNIPAAWGYVSTAVELDPYDAKIHYLAGQIAMDYGKKNEGCEHYAYGAILGSSKADRAVMQTCGGVSKWVDPKPTVVVQAESAPTTSTTETNSTETSTTTESTAENKTQDDEATDPFDMIEDAEQDVTEAKEEAEEKVNDTTNAQTPSDIEATDINLGGKQEEVESNEAPPVNIDATQDVVVDESIIITIGNGLGERKLNTKPNIFMLSDQDGIVVIDICVDKRGTVTEAEFNRETSTLFRSSLTSLALRKSKQFTFLPSTRDEQCGSLIFRIKA